MVHKSRTDTGGQGASKAEKRSPRVGIRFSSRPTPPQIEVIVERVGERFHLQEIMDEISDQQVRDRIAIKFSDEKLSRLDAAAARQFLRRRIAEWVVAGAALEFVMRGLRACPPAVQLGMGDVAWMRFFLARLGLPLKGASPEMSGVYELVITWMMENGLTPSSAAEWLVASGKSPGEGGVSGVFQKRVPPEFDALVKDVSIKWGISKSESVALLGALTTQLPGFHEFVQKSRERAREGLPPKRRLRGRPPKHVHGATRASWPPPQTRQP